MFESGIILQKKIEIELNYSLRYVIKFYEVKFLRKTKMFVLSRSFVNKLWCNWKLFVLQCGIAAHVPGFVNRAS